MITLPIEFSERMSMLLGEEYAEYLSSLQTSPVKGFRVNTDKISLEAFEKINPFGNEKIPFAENGFYLNYEKIGNHPYHHAGMIYVQEPAAMAPAECVEIDKNWHILDMCAAPGGKSTQLKNKLGPDSLLVSNEIIVSRCRVLNGNIERLGLDNTVVTCMDTARLAEFFANSFDMVMLDAPCSGEGMFRKEPAALEEWSVENVLKCAERQTELLENAARLVKNGGYIVYSTCTFSLEENEMAVDRFLCRHPEFEIVPLKREVAECTSRGIAFDGCKTQNIHYAGRCYPHLFKGEGQFMAVLKNKEAAAEPLKYFAKAETRAENKLLTAVLDFLDDVLTDYNRDFVKIRNGKPVYFGADFCTDKATVFSCGITIGELKGNYIKPHHQLFSALGKSFKRKIELSPDSEELKKYLHGEEISIDCANGWAAVTVDGCPLGGAKVVNGTAKNHYPKGLRIMA